ncbi:RteC domain-containing protein [Pedobacter nototheniae]|uniref:RteC domain-containing protein n=1 Tax=Pedobacter nototheniae TaxID=2488994 RepID=UPI00293135B2|nr:RteC domain-containing protein [Pedobacter nototheniae]
MILTAATTLFEELLETIEQLEQDNREVLIDPAPYLKTANHFMNALQSLVLTGSFVDQQEEILFFKTVKPKFRSLQIYYLTLQDITFKKPKGCKKILKKFYNDEIQKICSFHCYNQNLLNYYYSGATEMDEQLFLRKVEEHPHWLLKPKLERDERFSTPADYLVAKILAMEKIRLYLAEEIVKLQDGNVTGNGSADKKEYRWTGEAINLVELAYGLYYTGEINNGHAGIAEIVRLFETTFNIAIGKPSRRFAEIKQRKRLSKTKYLDQMKTAIDKRIDEDDEFVPKPNFR